MKKTIRVNTTLNVPLLEKIDQFAQENLEDRSTAVRQLIAKGLFALQEEKILNSFKKGLVTVREAASLLGLSYWELNELLEKKNIPLTNLSEIELKERAKTMLPVKHSNHLRQKSVLLAKST